MNIGFIGVGKMGKPMAENLIKANYTVFVFDTNTAILKEMSSLGANVCSNPKEIARESQVILLSLPHPLVIEKVVAGKDGIISTDITGKTIIDLSTVTPQTAIKMSGIVSEKGAGWIEVPVSGGEAKAKAGTLTMIVGGDEEIYKKHLPILEVLGEKINYIGKIGSAATIKLINQLLFGINLVGIAEAFTLADKMGVDFDKLYEVVSNGSGGSYALDTRYKNFIKKKIYDPGFSINLLLKDLNLVIDTGKGCGIPLPTGNLACDVYQVSKLIGYGNKDVAALLLAMKQIVSGNNTKSG